MDHTSTGAAPVKTGKADRRADLPFLVITLTLLGIGVVMVLSASFASAYYDLQGETGHNPVYFFSRQAIFAAAGVCVMLIASRVPMRVYRACALPLLLVSVASVSALLVLEPHFSATIIILAIGTSMLFLGGVRLHWFIGAAGVLIVGAVAAVLFVPYVAARVASFRDPFSDLTGDGWQIVQSLYAIGSGGLSGLGLGMSRQKYLYLPEEHNDFIFSVVCEELGFIGASAILLLFAMLVVRGYWISMQSGDRFSFLAGCGITTMLALQVVLNVAVCTNLVPCTGISLPFFSYGGTALLIQMGEAGILLSISRENPCAAYAPRQLFQTVKNQKIEE